MLSTWTQIERLLGDRNQTWPVISGGPPKTLDHAWPAVDVVETTDAYLILADLPGVPKDDLQLTIEGRMLTLAGERPIGETADVQWHCRERQASRFARRFSLGADLDAAAAEAVFEDGVLRLRIPKTAAAKPHLIEIK